MSIWDQFGDRLESQTTNPLFLGGAALLTGEGMGGAMRGMQLGNQFQQQRKKISEEEAQKQAWGNYINSGQTGLTPQQMMLAKAFNAPQGLQFASGVVQKAPELAMEREKLDAMKPVWSAQAAASTGAERRAAAMHGPQLETATLQAQTARRELDSPKSTLNIVPEGGTLVATDPRSGRHQVVAGGTPKQDATTKKEIQEADDFVMQTKSAISSLDRALELNNQAYAGAGASQGAWITNNTLGRVTNRPGAIATDELSNVVTNQALASLRATFGGNPTEGERKILLDVAGSVNQPAEVRRRIYERAKVLAEERLKFNQDKAKALRDGTYYRPGGAPPQIGGAPATPAPAPSSSGGWGIKRLD